MPPEQLRVLVAAVRAEALADAAYHLLSAGYRVTTAATGEEAWELVAQEQPALAVIDATLLTSLHEEESLLARVVQSGTPIIVVFSAVSTPDERLDALAAGADDILVHPVMGRELLLRARLRARSAHASEALTQGARAIEIDLRAHEARVHGEPVQLTRTEFALLAHLMEQAGRLCTMDALKARMWGDDAAASDRALRGHVSQLRTKLGPAGELIETVRGTGFRLRIPAATPRTQPERTRDGIVAASTP